MPWQRGGCCVSQKRVRLPQLPAQLCNQLRKPPGSHVSPMGTKGFNGGIPKNSASSEHSCPICTQQTFSFFAHMISLSLGATQESSHLKSRGHFTQEGEVGRLLRRGAALVYSVISASYCFSSQGTRGRFSSPAIFFAFRFDDTKECPLG